MPYYTLLTTVGAAKLTSAQASATPVRLTHAAVGDGEDGAAYDPAETQTALKNERWRGGINQIYVHATNRNWLVIEVIVPEASGGWFVREVGVFDAAGNMIAVGKYPETYKPRVGEGSAKDLYIRFILETSNTADVTLMIDPAIVLASRKYVDDGLAGHNADPNAHDGARSIIIPNTVFEASVADGEAVYWDAGARRHDEALADGSAANAARGIADVTNARVFTFGRTPSGLVAGMTPGALQYLDPATPGALTETRPASNAVKVGRAERDDVLFVDIDGVEPAAHDIAFTAGLGGGGEAEDLAVQRYGRLVMARDMTVEGEVLAAETAPEGRAAIFDVTVDGASIYTTKPQIADGAKTGTAGTLDPSKTDVAAGAVVEFHCTQAGSTAPGRLVAFTIKGRGR